MKLHPVLVRQLQESFGPAAEIPAELDAFLQTVSQTYFKAEEKQCELEQAMQLSSNDLLRNNVRLTKQKAVMERTILLLRQTRSKLTESEKVAGLTEELRKKNEALESQAEQLKALNMSLIDAQVKLVQAEKMTSLGLLTAGIAHEINNPINFITAGTQALETNMTDIFEVIAAYEKLYSAENSEFPEELAEIKQLKEELDFEEIMQDTRLLFQDIRTGTDRTVEVINSLRTFSRLDEDALKAIDIHENIDSTLVILRSQYKDKIEIVKNYDPVLSRVEAFPGKINQVFMNILSNAMQAIRESGEIRIDTLFLPAGPDRAEAAYRITISDNGPGMPEEVRSRIFEPFFTTKEIGKGTGLGLSIVHGIVEQHEGSIRAESRPGEGTSFVIELPVCPKDSGEGAFFSEETSN